MNRAVLACLLCAMIVGCGDAAPATRPVDALAGEPALDALQIMKVSEVRPGMPGYGLSVFSGTKIERFEVQVVSILRNFNPKGDVVLVRCKGANLEHTGAVAGMSGSPVFLKDEAGRYRLIGAFAYGWPLAKDPVGGVQPAEYMLEQIKPSTRPASRPTAEVTPGRARWSLRDVPLYAGLLGKNDAPAPTEVWSMLAPGPQTSLGNSSLAELRPLATPLMTSGLPRQVIADLTPAFGRFGLVPVQVGAGGGAAAGSDAARAVKLEPGAALAVSLLTGDAEMTAVGTCTSVVGDRVIGFGHPFNNEGRVELPMGTGQIHAVIANLSNSFKLGALLDLKGTLYSDQSTGIGGQLGRTPTMVPIELRVIYDDGSIDQTFSFQSALHPRFTPLLASAAFGAAMTARQELPRYHTVDYSLIMEFANGQKLAVANRAVDFGAFDVAVAVAGPLLAASDNPFQRVPLARMSGTIRVQAEAREARILSVNVPRTKYQPGETIKGFVTCRPFRSAEITLPIEFQLPRDLTDGAYQFTVGDWQTYLADEQTLRPSRFLAENADEVFDVLRETMAIRRNALYLRLVRTADGLAIGRAAMPHLPSSRRQVLMKAGLSNVTEFVSSSVKSIDVENVMEGSAQFTITIARDVNVETANPRRPARPPAPPKVDAPKSPATPLDKESGENQ